MRSIRFWERSSIDGPRACTIFVVTLLSFTGSCNVDRLGSLIEKADTRALAPGEASGAVNYQRRDSTYWDRHITRCRVDDSGALSFSHGASDPLLKINAAGASAYAIAYPPEGPARFDKAQCDTFSVVAPSAGQAGKETLICKKDGATLTTTIRFGACFRSNE